MTVPFSQLPPHWKIVKRGPETFPQQSNGHGQTDTKDGQLRKRRTVMEKTGTYGKDMHLRKRWE